MIYSFEWAQLQKTSLIRQITSRRFVCWYSQKLKITFNRPVLLYATIFLHSGSAITNTGRKLDQSDGNTGSRGTCENSKYQAVVYLTVFYRWQSADVSRRSKHCGYFWLFLTLQNTEQQNRSLFLLTHYILVSIFSRKRSESHWGAVNDYTKLKCECALCMFGFSTQLHTQGLYYFTIPRFISCRTLYFCSWIVKQ